MEIRRITAEEVYPVRHAVLRPGQPRETCYYDCDGEEGTFHLGAFVDIIPANGEPAGEPSPAATLAAVASYGPRAFAAPAEAGQSGTDAALLDAACPYQLRGMAVLEAYQLRGLGRYLLEAAYPRLSARGCTLLWCKARTPARGFYRHAGFIAVGEEFMTRYAGPHYVMYRLLKPHEDH